MTFPTVIAAFCSASLAFATCRAADPSDALIGTWRESRDNMIVQMVFTPQHEIAFSIFSPPDMDSPPVRGKWWLEGNQLFLQWHPDNGPLRAPIAKLTSSELVVTLGDDLQHVFRKSRP